MTLREMLRELVEEHGPQAVARELMFVLRRHMLRQAAGKYNLLPHTVGQTEIEGRRN